MEISIEANLVKNYIKIIDIAIKIIFHIFVWNLDLKTKVWEWKVGYLDSGRKQQEIGGARKINGGE